jgi:hypothetical protein
VGVGDLAVNPSDYPELPMFEKMGFDASKAARPLRPRDKK